MNLCTPLKFTYFNLIHEYLHIAMIYMYNVLVFRMPSASPQQQSWNKPWLLCMTPQQIKMANKVIIENNNNNHFSWIDGIEISERK